MRPHLFTLLIMNAAALAQAFDPAMPANVPQVSGTVVQLAAVRYIDVVKGTGTPAETGKRYKVHYTGWLRDGKKFDSSVDRNEPFEFVQGRRQVITGWDTGFEGMKVGGKRRLFIPYQFAYGELGRGPIPPKSELVFDVELLDVIDKPAMTDADEILVPFSDLEKKALSLAEAVPEEKYSWRPAPGVRSFAELFLHMGYGNLLLQRAATASPSREELNRMVEEHANGEKVAQTKAQIIDRLKQSFASVKKAAEGSGRMAREVDFFGSQRSQRFIFVLLDSHFAEHVGPLLSKTFEFHLSGV